ncbi:MAG: hypothetical protein LBE32_02890 [Burkholderiales bacterium]|jgi:YD repeat-containing protein|nr:hypothetical protein [Burkholderiales bacterium]
MCLNKVNPVGYTASQIDLVLGNRGRIPFKPTGSNTGYRIATFQSQVPGEFYGVELSGTLMSGFTITLKDDTVYGFSWYNSRLMYIQDCWGNRLGIVRDGSGKILQASTPNGRYLRFQYGHPNCATCITRVTDNIGRQTSCPYDVNGNLRQVTDATGQRTQIGITLREAAVSKRSLDSATLLRYAQNDGMVYSERP